MDFLRELKEHVALFSRWELESLACLPNIYADQSFISLAGDAKYAKVQSYWTRGVCKENALGRGHTGYVRFLVFISYSLQIATVPLTQRGRASRFCIFNYTLIFKTFCL